MMNERLQFLYQKYVVDQCTPDELTEFEALLRNPENEEAVKAALDKSWDSTNDAGGAAITSRKACAIYEQIVERPRVGHLRKWWLPAAAVLISVLLGVGFYLQRTESSPVAMVKVEKPGRDIEPGSNKASLRLSDGSLVALNEVGHGKVWERGRLSVSEADGFLMIRVEQNQQGGDTGYHTVTTPRAGKIQLLLPDQTKVWLNANSSLRFPAVFAKGERRVFLQGEAYFEVTKNKSAPFRVEARQTVTEVLGTHFNIAAYNDEADVHTTLLEGAVRVTAHNQVVKLSPGQQAEVSTSGIRVAAADIETAVSWKEGVFRFNSSSLEAIMHQLERWYDVQTVYKESFKGRRFTGVISRNTNLSGVLQMMELAGNIHFTIEGRKIIVSH